MNIVLLEPVFEPIFWEQVNQDILHYYFFAYDWKYNRTQTEILLALEEDHIDGMMLVYDKRIVQLRGSRESAKALLKRLDLEKIELQSPRQHKQYILEKYKPTTSHEMILMVLRKEQERSQTRHLIVKLGTSDAEQIATILKEADPEYWGTVTGQQIAERMSSRDWLGIKVNEELVSVSSIIPTEWTGLIGVVATHEAHRNKGYATSLVSQSVEQILEKLPIAMIYVVSDNPPAIRVYSKVGFKPYRTYFFMRGDRR